MRKGSKPTGQLVSLSADLGPDRQKWFEVFKCGVSESLH